MDLSGRVADKIQTHTECGTGLGLLELAVSGCSSRSTNKEVRLRFAEEKYGTDAWDDAGRFLGGKGVSVDHWL